MNKKDEKRIELINKAFQNYAEIVDILKNRCSSDKFWSIENIEAIKNMPTFKTSLPPAFFVAEEEHKKIIKELKDLDKEPEEMESVKYCDDCMHLSLTEDEQGKIIDCPPHMCKFYGYVLKHNGKHPHILRPIDCKIYVSKENVITKKLKILLNLKEHVEGKKCTCDGFYLQYEGKCNCEKGKQLKAIDKLFEEELKKIKENK